MTRASDWKRNRGLVGVVAVGAVALLSMATLVIMSVRQVAPPTFQPTPLEPRPAEGGLVGPELFTVDATASDRWRFFSFEEGTVVEAPGPLDWDLAFRRFQVIANGGPGFAGMGGVLDLGELAFDEVHVVPADGYVVNTVRSDTVNSAIRNWYDYSFFSHLLSPEPRVYAVRTAHGRYAKMQFVGYYCPGAAPGCVTFRYVYQGSGDTEMTGGDENSVKAVPAGREPPSDG